jgi:hypothetical protein
LKTACDLFVLERAVFNRILRDNESLARVLKAAAKERYGKTEGS